MRLLFQPGIVKTNNMVKPTTRSNFKQLCMLHEMVKTTLISGSNILQLKTTIQNVVLTSSSNFK